RGAPGRQRPGAGQRGGGRHGVRDRGRGRRAGDGPGVRGRGAGGRGLAGAHGAGERRSEAAHGVRTGLPSGDRDGGWGGNGGTPPPTAVPTGGGGVMTRPMRVLAVDDVAPALAELTRLLRESPDVGEVAEAGDPITALRLIQAGPLDAVFLDISMPGMSGLEL